MVSKYLLGHVLSVSEPYSTIFHDLGANFDIFQKSLIFTFLPQNWVQNILSAIATWGCKICKNQDQGRKDMIKQDTFHIEHAKLSPKLAEIQSRENIFSNFSFVGIFLTFYFTALYKGFCEAVFWAGGKIQKSIFCQVQ